MTGGEERIWKEGITFWGEGRSMYEKLDEGMWGGAK